MATKLNAAKSTGPRTTGGKARSRMPPRELSPGSVDRIAHVIVAEYGIAGGLRACAVSAGVRLSTPRAVF